MADVTERQVARRTAEESRNGITTRALEREGAGTGITIFSIPKAFVGHAGLIQRNAIISWTKIQPRPEILLLGDDAGVAEICDEFGLRHIRDVARTELGTPRVDAIFSAGEKASSHDVMAYANSDIILMDDFPRAIAAVPLRKFLLIGRRWGLDVDEPIPFEADWQSRLKDEAQRSGRQGGPTGLDYFVFSRGMFGELPPFAIGRTTWDNYLVYAARKRKATIVDGTGAITAIHQNHGYNHVAGGATTVWRGPEAERNYLLAGGVARVWDVRDADYRLEGGGMTRVPLSDRMQRRFVRQKATFISRLVKLRSRLFARKLRASERGAP